MKWKKVEGFPDYSVSTLGQVRRDETGHIVAPQMNQYGGVFVGLMLDCKQYHRSLPLLVARAHIKKPSQYFDTPINLDGDRYNCAVSNLAWRPRGFARRYHQQFKGHLFNTLEEPVKLKGGKEIFPNSFEAAKRFGLLERDLVLSIINNTVTWPTMQRFVKVE